MSRAQSKQAPKYAKKKRPRQRNQYLLFLILGSTLYCSWWLVSFPDSFDDTWKSGSSQFHRLLQSSKISLSMGNMDHMDTNTGVGRSGNLLPSTTLRMKATTSIAGEGHFESVLPRVLSIYFPQYHPDPLNDFLWGTNFTDWDSLRAAPEKNKRGFPIPRPSELGYYDLRDYETRKKQGELARDYGIDGFIMHHYWFYDPSHPGSNLHAPLMEMLKDGEPNVPFFLNWCAVRWVNVWMGKSVFHDNKVPVNAKRAITLQEQYFNATDDMILDHYTWLKPFFHHPNYIRIKGEPVFFVYQWNDLMLPILTKLREYAIQDGFPGLYLMVGRSAAPAHIYEPQNLTENLERMMRRKTQHLSLIPVAALNKTMTYPYPLDYITRELQVPNWCLNTAESPLRPVTEEIAGVVTTFDNTPRREYNTAHLWNVDVPDKVVKRFQDSLFAAIYFDVCCHGRDRERESKEDRFVVINAWNEWAEGMSLEPSDVYGRRFLEAVRTVKAQVRQDGCVL
jgi:hypothetical protein